MHCIDERVPTVHEGFNMTEVIFLGDHNRKIRRRAILFKLVRMKCISWSTTKAVNHYNKITTKKTKKQKKHVSVFQE